MKYIDMHCDTILGWLEQEEKGKNVSFSKSDLSIDLEKLKEGECLIQNFALFTDQKKEQVPEKQTMKLYDMYCRMLEQNRNRIAPVLRFEDIEKNEKEGKISALLTLEEGDVVFEDLAMLRNYYRLGVRMIALTWNYPNSIGFPNVSMNDFADYKAVDILQKPNTVDGLTAFGKRYIAEMERLGIIVDVSHLSDAGFWDVVENCKKPFVASHSNARALCNQARNLSDDMIRALAQKGGVMGLNFCADFLTDRHDDQSMISDMIAHIDHIRKVGGIDVIGIGSDFDGIHSDVEIKDASYMQLLKDALFEHGYTKEEVEKIFYKNVLRVYKACL